MTRSRRQIVKNGRPGCGLPGVDGGGLAGGNAARVRKHYLVGEHRQQAGLGTRHRKGAVGGQQFVDDRLWRRLAGCDGGGENEEQE